MKNQPQLIDDPPKPRANPRVMMHVIEASDCGGCEIKGSHFVRFECGKCGHETEWIAVATITEGKRGKPCPKCNK